MLPTALVASCALFAAPTPVKVEFDHLLPRAPGEGGYEFVLVFHRTDGVSPTHSFNIGERMDGREVSDLVAWSAAKHGDCVLCRDGLSIIFMRKNGLPIKDIVIQGDSQKPRVVRLKKVA